MKILKFFTKNCNACVTAQAILDDLKLSGKDVEVKPIDCELNPGMAQSYRVMTVPVLVFLNETQNPVARIQWKDINLSNILNILE